MKLEEKDSKMLYKKCESIYKYLSCKIDGYLENGFDCDIDKIQLLSQLSVFYGIGFISEEEYDKQYKRIKEN